MKITVAQIEQHIAEEFYHHFEGTNLVVCAIKMRNGYVASGKSCCIEDADFDLEAGKHRARARAIEELFGVIYYKMLEDQTESRYGN